MVDTSSYYLRDPDLPGIESRVCRDNLHHFPDHTHDVYSIGTMYKGGCYCLKRKDHGDLIFPGATCLINPGVVHSGTPAKGPTSYSMMYIDCRRMREFVLDLCEDDSKLPDFQSMVACDTIMHHHLLLLHKVFGSNADPLYKDSIFQTAMWYILKEQCSVVSAAKTIGAEPTAVRTTKEFIADNLHRKVRLADLAQATGLSRHHLLRVFKKSTGMTPHQYQIQRRIEFAKHLLRKGRPIAHTAFASGFTDQSHFSHKFKEFVGITPARFLSS